MHVAARALYIIILSVFKVSLAVLLLLQVQVIFKAKKTGHYCSGYCKECFTEIFAGLRRIFKVAHIQAPLITYSLSITCQAMEAFEKSVFSHLLTLATIPL